MGEICRLWCPNLAVAIPGGLGRHFFCEGQRGYPDLTQGGYNETTMIEKDSCPRRPQVLEEISCYPENHDAKELRRILNQPHFMVSSRAHELLPSE